MSLYTETSQVDVNCCRIPYRLLKSGEANGERKVAIAEIGKTIGIQVAQGIEWG